MKKSAQESWRSYKHFFSNHYHHTGRGGPSGNLLQCPPENKVRNNAYIYIYALSRCFYPKRLTVHSGYTFVLSVCVFPGNQTHNLCAVNAMLYHWATGSFFYLCLWQSVCLHNLPVWCCRVILHTSSCISLWRPTYPVHFWTPWSSWESHHQCQHAATKQ